MVNKSLIYGISGFILGGLLVAIAATTFDKNDSALQSSSSNPNDTTMTMEQMTISLHGLKGDAYDKAFLTNMTAHHQAAVNMAKLSSSSATHAEIKQLSQDILTAQEKEIGKMKQWQKDWGYDSSAADQSMHGM